MTSVMAAAVRSGRAFSGGAARATWGDGRDGALRPFGCRAVMIAHARVRGLFSVVGPDGRRLMALPAFNRRGARSSRERGSPRSINRGKGKGESLNSPLSTHSIRF
jgi:hypothetical protein